MASLIKSVHLGILLAHWQMLRCYAWVGFRPSFGRLSSSLEARMGDHDNGSISKEKPLRGLYPASDAIRNGTLRVDGIHTLYYQVHGKQGGTNTGEPLKALFLHGGPGAGCNPRHAQFFDPDRYQVVLLDQRGSGRSIPRGEVRNNTLEHLVRDCEALRMHLEIDRWDVVLGGSWGATLAIAYGQTYPESIGSIILRGVCLLRPEEVNWLFASDGGCALQLPQAWKAFEETVGVKPGSIARKPREALLAYYDKLLGTNDEERTRAARGWMSWEFFVSISHKIPSDMNTSDRNQTMAAINQYDAVTESAVAVHTLDGGWNYQDGEGTEIPDANIPDFAIELSLGGFEGLRQGLQHNTPTSMQQNFPVDFPGSNSRDAKNSSNLPAQNMLTCFYSVNDRYCMNNMNMLSERRMRNIRQVPCIAVQGGSDRICPPDTALDLLSVWPELILRVPLRAGHSMYDPFLTNELVRATDHFADVYSAVHCN